MSIKRLFEPVTIGNMEIKNRIAMAPITTRFTEEGGDVNQWVINYFAERAKGGAGLIMACGRAVESTSIAVRDFASRALLDENAKHIIRYSRLVDAVHESGAKIAIQLAARGRQGGTVAPSDTQAFFLGKFAVPKARALTLEEIEQFENGFALAAYRAKTAGFDAVLIDGGGGFLIAQFMSSFTNKRDDEYGGTLQNRLRFPLQIIQKIKGSVGPDYPLLFDLPANEFVEGGITPDESAGMAGILEKAGIDAFRIHVGIFETYYYVSPPSCIPRGVYAPLAKKLKDSVKHAKVMLGHRINDPLLAEELLETGVADVILMGRPFLADPELPKKAKEGRLEDIRKCIACNACTDRIGFGLPVACTVNPMVGKEIEYKLNSAQKIKEIFVIGGGVGGMEAARVAASRGHQVTIWERNNRLGGMANIAALPPFKYEIKGLIEYYITQLKKLNVDIKLLNEFTTKDLTGHNPDAFVIATGAVPLKPPIPGINMKHVVTAEKVLTENVRVGSNVVIIGGGQTGLETAEFLVEKGRKVTVLEMCSDFGLDMELNAKFFLLERFKKNGVVLKNNTRVDEIALKGVVSKNGFFQSDTVILAVGLKSDNSLYSSLKNLVPEIYAIGDCVKPRRLFDAIHEGARVGRQI